MIDENAVLKGLKTLCRREGSRWNRPKRVQDMFLPVELHCTIEGHKVS
jgi:hypothetical protein